MMSMTIGPHDNRRQANRDQLDSKLCARLTRPVFWNVDHPLFAIMVQGPVSRLSQREDATLRGLARRGVA